MIGIVLGFLLDFIFGDPYFMPHPIRWIGSLIGQLKSFGEKHINSEKALILYGLFIVFTVCGITLVLSLGLLVTAYKINIYLAVAVNALMCYYAIAMRCLKSESMKVYRELKKDNINGARAAVAMIVGRDTKSLDGLGVTKAAVETVAENTSDAVIAPMFYMFFGFGPFAMVYKAINTMDSMIAYKEGKLLYMGRVAARLDDIVNFIPSRLSALLMILSAFLLGYDYKNAFRIWKKDRFNHSSPNSAQTEAACAGALNIELGGDAYYFGRLHKKKYIGQGLGAAEYEDIKKANNILFMTGFLFLIFGLLLRGMIVWLWF